MGVGGNEGRTGQDLLWIVPKFVQERFSYLFLPLLLKLGVVFSSLDARFRPEKGVRAEEKEGKEAGTGYRLSRLRSLPAASEVVNGDSSCILSFPAY